MKGTSPTIDGTTPENGKRNQRGKEKQSGKRRRVAMRLSPTTRPIDLPSTAPNAEGKTEMGLSLDKKARKGLRAVYPSQRQQRPDMVVLGRRAGGRSWGNATCTEVGDEQSDSLHRFLLPIRP
ncbi:hypothetical protein TESG_08293 [Trichophyton tonsurans CBS 112818]|uniref:Uncharacterized protein n=1 Tax=Trichophyton tonsurans (strain CBS 112818) TaxID=647933 RepID=F2RQV5_TRIT1|nr:hypothetical protein TESG_08293 [Trichophyton tonsurans CBS 112818]